MCLILAVFSCQYHTNSFPSAVLIHSMYYRHKCRSISFIYGLMIDRHSKYPITYRASQAIIATIIRLPWKTFFLLTRHRYKVKKNNSAAKFQNLKRVVIEDSKGSTSPEKFGDVRETGGSSLEEHCTGITDIRFYSPFRPSRLCLSSAKNCEDHIRSFAIKAICHSVVLEFSYHASLP